MAINFTVSVLQALVSDVLFQTPVFRRLSLTTYEDTENFRFRQSRGGILGSGRVISDVWGGVHASMSPPPPGLVLRMEFRGWCEGQNVMFSVVRRER